MTSEKHGRVGWNELMTPHAKSVMQFYARLLGWSFTEVPAGDFTYIIAKKNGEQIAGIFDTSQIPNGEQMPNDWMPYFMVDDINRAVQVAKENECVVFREPFLVAGVGIFAITQDKAGAVIGIMQPDKARDNG